MRENGVDRIAGMAEEPADIGTCPAGVKKEIVKEAPAKEWRMPKTGDNVKVHYVGRLLSDGSQFDSSRDKGKPFEFCLGRGDVIRGWDLGVKTMKIGEIARFTLEPEHAYGDEGSPPKIPGKASLIFTIELLSFSSKDDLFGDGGAIKEQLKASKGNRKPVKGDEVLCTVRAMLDDGTVLEEKLEVEYFMGAGNVFEDLTRLVEKALMDMKRGEQVRITCNEEYMFDDDRTPDGGIVELELHEIYETKDVSFAVDKSLMKKRVKEGEGHEMPRDGHKTKVIVEDLTDGTKTVPGFMPNTLEFILGNGEVNDIVESVSLDMKKNERATVACTRPELCVEPQLGIEHPPNCEQVFLVLQMISFEKPFKEVFGMYDEEKVNWCLKRKEVGSQLFKRGRTELALERYIKVKETLDYIESFRADTKLQAVELKRVCELNSAACYLRMKEYQNCKRSCNYVLNEEADSVKALFRRAQAYYGLLDFSECQGDCRRVLELDPENKDARVLMKKAQDGQKSQSKKAKGAFAKMFKGINGLNEERYEEPEKEPEKEKKVRTFKPEIKEIGKNEATSIIKSRFLQRKGVPMAQRPYSCVAKPKRADDVKMKDVRKIAEEAAAKAEVAKAEKEKAEAEEEAKRKAWTGPMIEEIDEDGVQIEEINDRT
eukprot:CAMPEP_0197664152 /NCGR_PEP_ID=MMETSP1338-20131121/58462_1 /TAXON_ID=43686 ORGANISM="Pelagodinium beii, Strain RCC1491" /NCGR_SAMPLE_ID=MMETSP1338 /ASSEMBLY_ACC=CAM_ASM_000754 /LENGTH=655 /DNA_ID=CAMNT_0043242731 /DNA_START=49 /DNA_END=2016 /DNA_ORIENTATION=-